MKKNKGKIITITSSKGGVGKTILLLNLAGIYENMGKKVLILDYDFSGGSIALNLNLDGNKTIYQLTDDIRNHRYTEYYNYIEKYSNYIDVLCAPKDPRQVSKIDTKILVGFYEDIKYNYDVILVDTTHGLFRNNILTFDISDYILYVITNDFMDLKNTKNFMSVINDAEFNNVKVVLNESVNPNNDYFSIFDIKNIIKNNIDYTISSNSYVKNITKFLVEGKIFSVKKNKRDLDKMTKMAESLIK